MFLKELYTEICLVKMAEPAEIKTGLTKERWSRYSCGGRECSPPGFMFIQVTQRKRERQISWKNSRPGGRR